MSKVYQTTDSIHVETATLPGNSPTNRDGAARLPPSLSEYHYGMSRRASERAGGRGRGRDEGEVASSQAHNATSFCARAEPAGRKLSARSSDPNHHFLTTRKEGRQDWWGVGKG